MNHSAQRCFVLFSALAAALCSLICPRTLANGGDGDPVIERFNIAVDGDNLTVPVTIKGRSYNFVVDTGSSGTVCDKSLAPLLGARVGVARAKTVNGAITSPVFRSSEMAVGQMPLRAGMLLITADLSQMCRAMDGDIRGFLGMDFLSAHIVRLDFDRGELQFLKSTEGVAGDPLPLIISEKGEPKIRAVIPETRDIEFYVDTGYSGLASGGVSVADFADLVQRGAMAERGSVTIATPNGVSTTRTGLLTALSIGGFQHTDLVFDELRNFSGLGLYYWSRFVVTFDFPNGTVYLAPGRRFGLRDLRDMSGLHLWRVDGTARVSSVDIRSPAERRGILAGDALLRINDVDAATTRLHVLRQMLCSENKAVDLLIRRGEDTESLVLQLRDWRTDAAVQQGGQNGGQTNKRTNKRDRSNKSGNGSSSERRLQ